MELVADNRNLINRQLALILFKFNPIARLAVWAKFSWQAVCFLCVDCERDLATGCVLYTNTACLRAGELGQNSFIYPVSDHFLHAINLVKG